MRAFTAVSWSAAALFAATGCGSDPVPTSPAPSPVIPVSVMVTPTPIAATFVSSDGKTSAYRATVEITFAEVGGVGVRIDKFTETTTTTLQTEQGTVSLSLSATSDVSHQIPAGASVTQSRVLQFGASTGDRVTWSVHVAGVDSQGRPFATSSPTIAVVLVGPGATGGG